MIIKMVKTKFTIPHTLSSCGIFGKHAQTLPNTQRIGKQNPTKKKIRGIPVDPALYLGPVTIVVVVVGCP